MQPISVTTSGACLEGFFWLFGCFLIKIDNEIKKKTKNLLSLKWEKNLK